MRFISFLFVLISGISVGACIPKMTAEDLGRKTTIEGEVVEDSSVYQSLNCPKVSLSKSAVTTEPSCENDSTGSIKIDASKMVGMLGRIHYSINEGGYQVSPDFLQVPVGKHYFKIKDSFGCMLQLRQVEVSAKTCE